MDWFSLMFAGAAAAIASLGLAGILRRALVRLDVMDHPNARSSHTRPTPRGGGLAVLVVVLAGWLMAPAFIPESPPAPVAVILAAGVLVAFFWFEDTRGLPLLMRFGLQGIVAAAVLFFWPGDAAPMFFQGLLPESVDLVFAWLGWIWFMNLYNFMDGIDGISVAESIAIGLGATLVGVLTVAGEDALVPGVVIAGAMVGFFWWNRPPARLFLGDVGSVPLGFLLGFLLLDFAARGLWAPALILPLYYLGDATVTLLRRAVRGEKIWQAHRDHFYQLAVCRGLTHGGVTATVAAVNLLLIGLAVLALDHPWIALGLAVLLVATFLLWLGGAFTRTQGSTP